MLSRAQLLIPWTPVHCDPIHFDPTILDSTQAIRDTGEMRLFFLLTVVSGEFDIVVSSFTGTPSFARCPIVANLEADNGQHLEDISSGLEMNIGRNECVSYSVMR